MSGARPSRILASNRPPLRWTVLGSSPRHRRPAVPPELVEEIREALEEVDEARAALAGAVAEPTPLETRRTARRRVRTAFDRADALLREATTRARDGDSPEWSRWRARLSRLDDARQANLFAEMDDSGAILPGSVRIVDYGMSGPDIGDLQYGRSLPPGAPARIGLDQATMLDEQARQT